MTAQHIHGRLIWAGGKRVIWGFSERPSGTPVLSGDLPLGTIDGRKVHCVIKPGASCVDGTF